MDDLAVLLATEAIKRLKARYFYLVDTKQWDAWAAEIWADDGELSLPGLRAEPFRGREAILTLTRTALGGVTTIHHGQMPIIDIVSPFRATGIWAMEERHYAAPGAIIPRYHGWGHYTEDYIRTEAGWRIARSTLTKVHSVVRDDHSRDGEAVDFT